MADDLLELLDYLPDREQEALAEPRFRSAELCARLLRRVDEIRLVDPRAALAPARLAIRLTTRLSDTLFGQAWATWASVHRALANYETADLGHRIARLYLEDPVDLARFYRRRAYLSSDRGRFQAAKKDLDRALSIYLATQDTHSRGCTLVDLGIIHFAESHVDEAVSQISEALRYLDPERDPIYHQAAIHNLAVALSQSNQPAARLEDALREIRKQRFSQGSLPWAKHRWLEGLVLKRRGRTGRAEITLRSAINQLVKLGAAHDAGLALMDLAELFLARGDWKKSAELARQMFPVFKTLGVEREAVAAFRLYSRAAVGRTLTQAHIGRVRRTLRRFSYTAARP